MADRSNPRVAVSVTGGAAEGGGLVGVQGLSDAPSCVVPCPPAACFACPHQSSPLFEQHSAMHCGHPLSAPRCLGQCLQVEDRACRHPLKHSAGWPAGRCPVASSPYSTSFGMRPSPMSMHVAEPNAACTDRGGGCML